MKPITKEQFKELVGKHLFILEGQKLDENGNGEMQVFGIDNLYDELSFCCCDAPLIRTSDKGGNKLCDRQHDRFKKISKFNYCPECGVII